MYTSTYTVDRATGTFADTLLSVGLALFLHDVLDQETMTIRDTESGFLIELERSVEEQDLADARFRRMLPYLLTLKSRSGQPEGARIMDYEAMRQRQTSYWAQRRTLEEETGKRWRQIADTEQGQVVGGLEPPPDWPLFQAINQMSAIAAYNGAIQTWEASRHLIGQTARAVLRAFCQSPNDLVGAEREWRLAAGKMPGIKLDATWSQIFNPFAGKGQSRAKMDGVAMTNSSGFWLWEYLKFAGGQATLAPRSIQSKDRTKDRKSYALAPAALDLDILPRVFKTFHNALQSRTAVKMDILAIIVLTLAVLDDLPERFSPDLPQYGRGPDQSIRGLHTAYYKYLGTSAAVMNLSFLAVPTWMRIYGRNDIERYRAILLEHQIVVARIDEDRSEGYELLRTYRDFLSEASIWPLFEFCAGYGAYLMSDWERGRPGQPPARQFSVSNLKEVFVGMEPNLSDIVGTDGFQSIAYAIRRSTVTPQYQKSRNQPIKYEIRYGLGTDLMRKANYNDEFATVLAEFVQAYNAENAQKAETQPHPPYRRNVRTEDLVEVMSLIDHHGAKLVGSLLVAFGYATERSEPGVPTGEVGDSDSAEQRTEEANA